MYLADGPRGPSLCHGSAPAGEPEVSLKALPAWESHTSRKLNTTLPAPAAHLGDPEGIKDGHITGLED